MTKLAAAAAAIAVAVLSFAAAPALAHPGPSPAELAQPAPAQPMQLSEPMEEKSEQAAIGLSVLGSIAPLAVTIGAAYAEQYGLVWIGGVGMLLGPSIGHWYAGRAITGGMLMRAGGTAMMFAGVVQAFGNMECGDCGSGAAVLAYSGAALFIGGTLYDIATAGRSVRRWNEKHVNLGPAVVGSASGPVPGVGLSGSF